MTRRHFNAASKLQVIDLTKEQDINASQVCWDMQIGETAAKLAQASSG